MEEGDFASILLAIVSSSITNDKVPIEGYDVTAPPGVIWITYIIQKTTWLLRSRGKLLWRIKVCRLL